MNGNFEHDKGAYPYTATRIGFLFFVLNTPTQEKVCNIGLPIHVAQRFAMRLNTAYWGHTVPAVSNPLDDATVRFALESALYEAYYEDELDGVQFQQLKDRIK